MSTKLNKSDWIIISIILATTVVFGSIDYYREGNKLIEYLIDFPVAIVLTITIIIFFIQIIIPKFLVKKKHYFLFFIYAFVFLVVIGTIDKIVGNLTAGNSLKNVEIFPFLIGGLYNAVDMGGFPLAILLIKKFYEGQQELVLLQKQQKESELKLLRGQLDPHFLFNNLNTLDSLIDSNPTKAKEYINRLSLIYRYLIQTKDAEVMELSEELALIKNYIFLIQTRFGNDYQFTIEENINLKDKFIPTGALQTLLENVVKHNKSDGIKSIQTSVKINEGWIIVTNSKTGLLSKNESFGTGLENLKARYQLLSDEQIQVHDMDNKFEVFIPIIQLQGV